MHAGSRYVPGMCVCTSCVALHGVVACRCFCSHIELDCVADSAASGSAASRASITPSGESSHAAFLCSVLMVPSSRPAMRCISRCASSKNVASLAHRLPLINPGASVFCKRGAGLAGSLISRRTLRPGTIMQTAKSDNDDEKIDEERAKLDRLFKMSSALDSATESKSGTPSSGLDDNSGNDNSAGTPKSDVSSADGSDTTFAADYTLPPTGDVNIPGKEDTTDASTSQPASGVRDVGVGGRGGEGGGGGQVADTMEQAMSQSHAAIISAVLSGTRGLTVSVNLDILDYTSRSVWPSHVDLLNHGSKLLNRTQINSNSLSSASFSNLRFYVCCPRLNGSSCRFLKKNVC